MICTGSEPVWQFDYRCSCCSFQSDDLERFTLGGFCWDCSTSSNLGCVRCRRRGIAVTRFDRERGVVHRFSRWRGFLAVTACGQRIHRANLTGPGEWGWCEHCWGRARGTPSLVPRHATAT